MWPKRAIRAPPVRASPRRPCATQQQQQQPAYPAQQGPPRPRPASSPTRDEAHGPLRPGPGRRPRGVRAATEGRRAPGGAHRHREPAERGQPRRHLLVHVRVRQRHQGGGARTARPGPAWRGGRVRAGLLLVRRRRRQHLLRHLHRRRERIPAAGRASSHTAAHPRGHPEGPRVQREEPRARGGRCPAAQGPLVALVAQAPA